MTATEKINWVTDGDPCKDSDELTWEQMGRVLQLANETKYRKPKNANGSRGRYYYQKLQREYRRELTAG